MDGPLIRQYMQDYNPDDQPNIPPEKRCKGLCITKYHHGLCDGVSFMCMVLGLGKEYSRDYFIKSSDAKWYEELFVRLTFPFHIPRLLMNTLFMGADNNFLTKRKDLMNGQLNIRTSKSFDFHMLKSLSKTIKVSINDIITSAITTAFK